MCFERKVAGAVVVYICDCLSVPIRNETLQLTATYANAKPESRVVIRTGLVENLVYDVPAVRQIVLPGEDDRRDLDQKALSQKKRPSSKSNQPKEGRFTSSHHGRAASKKGHNNLMC